MFISPYFGTVFVTHSRETDGLSELTSGVNCQPFQYLTVFEVPNEQSEQFRQELTQAKVRFVESHLSSLPPNTVGIGIRPEIQNYQDFFTPVDGSPPCLDSLRAKRAIGSQSTHIVEGDTVDIALTRKPDKSLVRFWPDFFYRLFNKEVPFLRYSNKRSYTLYDN